MTLLKMQENTSSGKSLVCEHCDSGDSAVSRCTNCSVFMCEFCVTAHKRIIAFKGHQILSLAEVQKLGSKALVKPAFCGKHAGEVLKLFCETCQETICRDCTIVDHRKHKYNFVADVAERERKVVQGVLEETKAKDSAVEEAVRAVQIMEGRMKAKTAEISKEVDGFFDEQVKTLENLRTSLQNELTVLEQGKLKELESQREMLTLSLAQLRSSAEFAEKALADGGDMELLSMKQQLIQRLAQLNASHIQCRPCKSDYLKLQVNKTIGDIGKVATLLYIPVDPASIFVLSMVGGEEGVLYQTLAGQPVDFMLVIKDRTAVVQPKTGYVFHASVNHSREANLDRELPVHNNGNGSYSFSYRPETDGLCTLSVKVEGDSVCGSPLTWKVKPKVKGTNDHSLLTSTPEQAEGGQGKHCWKLMYLKGSSTQGGKFEIGVSCYTPADGVSHQSDTETKRCTWCCNVRRSNYNYSSCDYSYSRSDSQGIKASITNFQHGDIFSVYLNRDTKKLLIYNQRSKQVEVFTDVQGEKVRPIISPYLSGVQGYGFTLDIN